MKRPLPSVFRGLLERVLECHVRLFFTETKGLSCLPSAPGRDISPSLRVCFVPAARAVTGAGFALVLQIQGFCSGEHFLKACSAARRQAGFSSSHPQFQLLLSVLHGVQGHGAPGNLRASHPHRVTRNNPFSLPFPFLACLGTAWRHYVMSWCQVSGP